MKKRLIGVFLSTTIVISALSTFGVSAAENENEIPQSLPAKVDLRDYNGKNYVTRAKLQSPFGTCWAFGAAAAAETSYLFANDLGVPAGEENKNVDFSEKYISWYIYHGITEADVTPGKVRASQVGEGYDVTEAEATDRNSVYMFGGNANMAFNLFASGFNPVDESVSVNGESPYYYSGKNRILSPLAGYNYNDDWTLPLNAEYRNTSSQILLRNAYLLPSPSDRDEDGKYKFNEAGLEAIKSQIATGHGVAVGICVSDRFNTDNWTDYNNSITSANHEVTIIGYDDNFPKENFTRYNKLGNPIKKYTPPGDGAFIVKNSAGSLTDEDRATATTDENGEPVYQNPNAYNYGIDGNGCFYLSYYDRTISLPVCFDFDRSEDVKYAKQNYDQYDLMMSGLYFNSDYDSETKMANVFDAEEDEYLRQISYMTNSPETSVHYEIYKNFHDGDPASGTLLDEGDNFHEFAGSHKIDLSGEYFLKKGEKYSVVLTMKYKSENGEASVYTDVLSVGANIFNNTRVYGIVNEGESYLYTDGKWSDMVNEKDRLIDEVLRICAEEIESDFSDVMESIDGKEDISIDNFPIKAILVPASEHGAVDILGDVDGDGAVSISDATAIQYKLAEFPVETFNEAAADVDGDSAVLIDDVTLIQQYLADMEAPDGIGKPIA